MINLFNYIERQSPIHRLTGASKLAALLLSNKISPSSSKARALISSARASAIFPILLTISLCLAASCVRAEDKNSKYGAKGEAEALGESSIGSASFVMDICFSGDTGGGLSSLVSSKASINFSVVCQDASSISLAFPRESFFLGKS